MSLLGTGQSGQKLNETEGSAEGAQATGHGKHTWEHEGAMKMSGRHQGGLEKKKNWSVEQTRGPVGEELPAIITSFSERRRKQGG